MPDPSTLRMIANLARDRAALRDLPGLMGSTDGMVRLGARRVLEQLAKDLEAAAADIEGETP
jgi:hypothetical protein